MTMLDTLLPELFPLIAAQLPRYCQPATLLSLALANRALCGIIIPDVLYNQITLEGEKQTFKVLDVLQSSSKKTSDESLPPSHKVQRLYIRSSLSKESRDKNTSVIKALEKVIQDGCLPNLKSLAIHLRLGWYYDETFQPIRGFGRLDDSFWSSLKIQCPRLKEISLSGFNDDENQPWFEHSGIYNVRNLVSFQLDYCCGFEGEGFEAQPALCRLLDNLETNSSSLVSLTLQFETMPSEESLSFTETGALFTRHFPSLRSLSLKDFAVQDVAVAMEFWSRHPDLDQIEIRNVDGECFASPSPGLLPSLRVLTAPFQDLVQILPIVGSQLINLTVESSINAQVPYLLRSVLPNGLASLQSLGIKQSNTQHPDEIAAEGSRWDEDEHGLAIERSKRKAARFIDARYVSSLFRAVPNLEELELKGQRADSIESLTEALSSFKSLRRLYLSDPVPDLLEETTKIAAHCSSLESLTESPADSSSVFTCARIQRDEHGKITAVHRKRGCGRVIGLDGEPFPAVFALS